MLSTPAKSLSTLFQTLSVFQQSLALIVCRCAAIFSGDDQDDRNVLHLISSFNSRVMCGASPTSRTGGDCSPPLSLDMILSSLLSHIFPHLSPIEMKVVERV